MKHCQNFLQLITSFFLCLINNLLYLSTQVSEVPISSSKASTSAEEEKGPTAQEAYKLPAEFYHFYFGSQLDLGTLIEVCHILTIAITCQHKPLVFSVLRVHLLWTF